MKGCILLSRSIMSIAFITIVMVVLYLVIAILYDFLTAARLAQLGERRSAEREAVGSNPGWTNTQGL